jgi:CRISPR-associated endonuclease/helicase Cas3
MSGNIRTISKHDGLDLYSHSESVRDTAFIINAKGRFHLDCKVLYWSSILHDIGKMNPLFLENMDNNDFTNIMRHEIASLCFIEIVPEDVRDIVAFVILSHHKSINNDERSIIKLYNEDEDTLFNNHIGDIKVWGDKVRCYFLYHYGIEINIPSFDECKLIFETYVDKINNLEKGYSLYRGLFMMADHFASCYPNNEERVENLDSLFYSLDLSYYHSEDSRYPLSLINKDESKKHTLCIAPTGCGKTNFMMKMC